MEYNFNEIENKWRKAWKQNKTYQVNNVSAKPKCYVLDMFPYPSGAGLHVGHPLGYIASDIYARYKRLKGFNVLHPMGFDSFGLPAEQYALETGQHPTITTQKNIARYKEQLDNIGFCFDWEREVQTSDPQYYKHTQWLFLQLYNAYYNKEKNKAEPIEILIKKWEAENTVITIVNTPFDKNTVAWNNFSVKEKEVVLMHFRLAYQAESTVNWCEALGTVLANDEVVNGVSERGGHPVEKKLMTQWFLRITAFTERLLEGLNRVDFPESLKEMQRNWIGKSEGAELYFTLTPNPSPLGEGLGVRVFTTRPDTLFGVSFLVLAPEHELVKTITTATQKQEIEKYISYVKSRSERERLTEVKKITGCFTGAYAYHPITQEPLPIWISEYVLAGYGTGAIMAVPAGDDRDFAFAKHFQLPIPSIFENIDISQNACTDKNAILTHSDFLNGLQAKDAIVKMLDYVQENNVGERKINYKMRDAGFSRQRYWGEPFPIIFDKENVPQTDNNLPVELPFLEKYSAGPNGKGPLANASHWVSTPTGTRETDTMPGYAGSSWYYLRYTDPSNANEFASRQATDYWNQVDVYVGGAEHAVGHLLYSRMWCKCLFDLGYISFDEPYKKLINQGMIQGSSRLVYRIKGSNTFVSAGLKNNYETDELFADVSLCDGIELDINAFTKWRPDYANATFELENGKYICGVQTDKMSKSKYNVVNPDDIIAQYGADTFRMYEMFLGPIEMSKPWDTKGIEGVHRFIKKFWRLFFQDDNTCKVNNEKATDAELKILHKHIKKIEYDIENFAYNTSVSQFMIATNEFTNNNCSKREILEPMLITLAPFAPHIAEELYHHLEHSSSVLDASFPIFEEKYIVEDSFVYPIAINGKARTEMEFALDADQKEIENTVLQNDILLKWTENKPVKKFIFVKGKMINVVV